MGSGRPRSALGPARFRAVFNSSRSLELVCGDGSVAVSLRTSRGYVTPHSTQNPGRAPGTRAGTGGGLLRGDRVWEVLGTQSLFHLS